MTKVKTGSSGASPLSGGASRDRSLVPDPEILPRPIGPVAAPESRVTRLQAVPEAVAVEA